MDWSPESLYNKAKVFAERAHDESIESALFGFWMSLTLEMLARAALAHIHPALLADPREPDNIQYAFGIYSQKRAQIYSSQDRFRALFGVRSWLHRQDVWPLPNYGGSPEL